MNKTKTGKGKNKIANSNCFLSPDAVGEYSGRKSPEGINKIKPGIKKNRDGDS